MLAWVVRVVQLHKGHVQFYQRDKQAVVSLLLPPSPPSAAQPSACSTPTKSLNVRAGFALHAVLPPVMGPVEEVL